MRLHPFPVFAAFSLLLACGGSEPVIPASTVRKVTVTGSATSMNVGDMMTLTATGLDANGAVVSNSGLTIWTSSATTVATVNQSGKVTAVGAGTTVITADIANVQGNYSVKVNLAGTASRSPR
ncbi:MAG: Ig-like domain-containing protein [Gemmatimonadota bacterium]|nr:Ig-like domain-containing protein [Gemmatimonadota bacterium]